MKTDFFNYLIFGMCILNSSNIYEIGGYEMEIHNWFLLLIE